MSENIREINEKVLKIKNECISIQKNDLSDQVKNIENENNKSWLIIWFVWALIAIIWWDIEKIDYINKIILFVLFCIPMIVSLYNLSSKKVKSHINIYSYFVNRTNQYESFINDIHMRLKENYDDSTRLLLKKAWLTKIAYFFTILLLMFILKIKLF